jgi:NAD(P)-dependent dehydrogenase (short-subunit alcohol dehydrogenase family)
MAITPPDLMNPASPELAKKPFGLDGQTALITGGGTGLGLGMARCLAAAGARVVLVGRREDELKKAVAELGASASFVRHDVTAVGEADKLVEAAARAAGAPIDILINNAGVHLKKPAVETTPEEFFTVLNTHVLGAHALTRAVLPGMIQRRRGNILFIASMAALFGFPKVVAYAAAKSAYVGMVRTLATEVSMHDVRVNAIAPGWIDSAMMRKALDGDPARRDKILGRTPMNRFGEADDIGWAAVYLCSPAAKFITGVVLPVDGGVSIGF